MKNGMTSSVNKGSRNPYKTYKKRIKVMLAITCLSVFTACVTIVLSVLICIHYKYAGENTITFAEDMPEETEDRKDGDTAEAISDSVYSQAEVDALMDAARESASAQGEAGVLDTLQQRLMNGDSSLDSGICIRIMWYWWIRANIILLRKMIPWVPTCMIMTDLSWMRTMF